ncbi:DUF3833 domain-containing protein [Ferrimonas balearica]|uniref:DUF3833 domain-containing protein n=1 Tax=Ferrimonas balearica TaxID=44012 RepID=UPI001C999ABB|nr:DUF3833 domain-containing protein [Ferrimonas balearica]MBY5921775.1 DUF3833 domain-containing protein [Ferrimonas balearica]MBY5994885.1 DUF3833 domain-containing protein [Ferrimonas balearica]
MTLPLRHFAIAALMLLLGACSGGDLTQYQGKTPALHLPTFFQGPLLATGMVQDRSGNVTRRFTVEMTGTWQGNEGVLDETFYWEDGEVSKRIWRLTDLGEGRYQGEADDVLDQAEGLAVGPVLKWRYKLQLPEEQGGWVLTFDDTMVLVNDDELLNVAVMTKWGLEVGRVVLTIRKVTD